MHVAHVRAGHPAMQDKFGGTTKREGGKTMWTGLIKLSTPALLLPLKWTRRRRIFVNSMSDLFHEQVTDVWIAKVIAVMHLASQHEYQVLTKRPERMAEMQGETFVKLIREQIGILPGKNLGPVKLPLPNVWLGTSVEDQDTADRRIPHLLRTPAAVRFLSAEPLLSRLHLHDAVFQKNSGVGWVIAGGERPRRSTV